MTLSIYYDDLYEAILLKDGACESSVRYHCMGELCEVSLQGAEHRRISILSWPLHCHLYMYADRASDIACCDCKCVVFTHTRTHARIHCVGPRCDGCAGVSVADSWCRRC